MDYITVRQAAEKWGIKIRQVQNLLKMGRIPGAVQPARDWLIPKDAAKPADERRNNRRQPKKASRWRAKAAAPTPDKNLILLVEDNKHLNEINRRNLQSAGYEVLTALNLAQAREHLRRRDPDVILLDVFLPDGSGMDLCREIRARTAAHILFLTSLDEHSEKIKGLDMGGDDYITKPYKLDELLSRVGAAVRRHGMRGPGPAAETVTRGALTLNIVLKRAYLGGADMALASKEFELLYLFIKNEGQILSADEVYKAVWVQPSIGDANALRVAVSRLRKKLEADENGAFIIESVRNEGYLFTAAS
ncbi:MAG: response regulator [Gracilibacteraceae bacterium]|nr:response regulator [Gracilibacteraceae bacterium]